MKSVKSAILVVSLASLLFVGTGTAVARADVGTMLRERVAQPVRTVLASSSDSVRTKSLFEEEKPFIQKGPVPIRKIVNGVAVLPPEPESEEISETEEGQTAEEGSSSQQQEDEPRVASDGSSNDAAADEPSSPSADNSATEPALVSDGLPRIAGPGKGGNDIRIHISGFAGTPEISGSGGFAAYSGPFQVGTFSAGERVSVRLAGSEYVVNVRGNDVRVSDPVRFVPSGGVLSIANYNNRPAWNPAYNDNLYRGKLEVVNWGGRPIVVNEINLEDYMKGLAEMTNSSPVEKIKAITIAARSYAKFYMVNGGKFAGPYDLDDSPARSQKYLGYGYEQRAGNVTVAVNATRGMVLGYNGVIIKAPYFSQSDGVATRSALDVWGWNHTPYLVSVDDSACITSNGSFAGHGVGMSGCGAHGMAVNGASYRQILEHYYTGIQVLDLY